MQRLYFIIFMSLFISSITHGQSAKKLWKEAIELNKKGEYQSAITLLNKAIAKKPTFEEPYNTRGWSKQQLKMWEASISDFEQYLKYHPDDSYALVNIGTSYCNINRCEKAYQCYQQALELNPRNALAWWGISIYYARRNESEKALEAANKSLEISPSEKGIYYNRSIIYEEHFQDIRKAYSDIKVYLSYYPQNYDAHVRKGRLLRKMKRYTESFDAYTKAIDLAPANTGAYIGRAQLRQFAGDSSGASMDLVRVVRADCEDADCFRDRGMAKGLLKLYPQALDDFRSASQLDNHNNNPIGMSIIYRQTGQYDSARVYALKALQLDSNYAWVYYNLGLIDRMQDRTKEAVIMLEKAFEMQKEPKFAYQLALALASLEEVDQARVCALLQRSHDELHLFSSYFVEVTYDDIEKAMATYCP